ncbi:MAG TPA: nuclear transport factor 2 family protein [Allocoleopsis sp.]
MSDTQAVLAINQAFYRAFQQKDLQAMSLLWVQSSNAICVHPGRPALQGWEQIRLIWEQIFRTPDPLPLENDVIAVEVNGNMAYVIQAEKMVQQIQGRPMTAQSIATNIFERVTTTWLLVHRHSSPILPPPSNQAMPNQMGG